MLLSPAGKGHHCSTQRRVVTGGGEVTTSLQRALSLSKLGIGRNK